MNWLRESGTQPLLGTYSKIKNERRGREGSRETEKEEERQTCRGKERRHLCVLTDTKCVCILNHTPACV